MNTNKILLAMIAVLILAIGLSWLAIHSIIRQQQALSLSNQAGEPDSYIINAHYKQTNSQGQITEELFSPKIIHYDQNDVSQFDQPRLILYGKKSPWIITANTGTSMHGSEEIILQDNVKIVQNNPTGNTELTTSTMTVWPKKKFAGTQAAVTIVQPGSMVQGQGMTVNMETGEINLLSQARGQYAPQENATHSHQ